MEVNPQTLFEMTGIFDADRAMQRFNKAAGMFLLALKDMGGQVDEGPGLGIVWAGALKLPPRGFILLLTVMRKLEWIDRTMKADRQFCLLLTPKGHLKADNYKISFDAALADDGMSDDA
jgi:hypothetical protein